jgi:hypothetical protein
MNELVGRVSSFFVEPATAETRPAPVASPEAPSVALLCRSADAAALGSGLAITLARRTQSAISVVVLWRPRDPQRFAPRAPATRGAGRLATSLRTRDVPVVAAGRVVRATLPADPAEAVAGAERVYAATDAPVVLVIAGPRTEAIDAMLARQDALLVASDRIGAKPDPVAELAARRLAGLGPPVETLTPALPPLTRALATAGIAAPSLRALGDLGRVVA